MSEILGQAESMRPVTYSNPNLLDNWYFGNPVNQRGIVDGQGFTDAFIIDRWKLLNNGTINFGSDYIQVSEGNGTSHLAMCHLTQAVENQSALSDKIVTISILTDSGCYWNTGRGFTSVLFDNGHEIAFDSEYWFAINIPQNKPLKIYAVKLELGSQQTLAHQENGVWVLNEIPDYGEQLLRCQRYYTRYRILQYNRGFLGLGEDAETVIFSFSLPVTMREAPSVSYSGDLRLYQPPDNFIKVINIVSGFYSNNKRGILFKTNGNITQNAVYELYVGDTEKGIIEFNADL